jgi:hypothetical protein
LLIASWEKACKKQRNTHSNLSRETSKWEKQ